MVKRDILLFFVGFLLLQIGSTFDTVIFLQPYLKAIRILGTIIIGALAAIIIVNDRKDYKKLLLYIFLIAFGTISLYITKNFLIISTILILISAKNIKFDTIIKYDLLMKLVIITSITIFFLVGLTEEVNVFRESRLRYSMGFIHPNVFAMYFLIMVLELFYLRKEFTIIEYLILNVAAIIIFIFTDSKTTVLCILLMDLLSILQKFIFTEKTVNSKIFNFLSRSVYWILSCASFLLTILFKNKVNFAFEINKKFSGRLWFQNLYMQQHKLNLLGSPVKSSYILDNFYFRTIYYYGIFGLVFYGITISLSLKKAIKNYDYFILIIFIICLFYGTMEHLIFDYHFAPFILYATSIATKNKIIQKEKNII